LALFVREDGNALVCNVVSFRRDRWPSSEYRCAKAASRQYFAIRGVTVVPLYGPRLENATVIIARGADQSRDEEAPIPDEDLVMPAKGPHRYPGCVDAFTGRRHMPDPCAISGEGAHSSNSQILEARRQPRSTRLGECRMRK